MHDFSGIYRAHNFMAFSSHVASAQETKSFLIVLSTLFPFLKIFVKCVRTSAFYTPRISEFDLDLGFINCVIRIV